MPKPKPVVPRLGEGTRVRKPSNYGEGGRDVGGNARRAALKRPEPKVSMTKPIPTVSPNAPVKRLIISKPVEAGPPSTPVEPIDDLPEPGGHPSFLANKVKDGGRAMNQSPFARLKAMTDRMTSGEGLTDQEVTDIHQTTLGAGGNVSPDHLDALFAPTRESVRPTRAREDMIADLKKMRARLPILSKATRIIEVKETEDDEQAELGERGVQPAREASEGSAGQEPASSTEASGEGRGGSQSGKAPVEGAGFASEPGPASGDRGEVIDEHLDAHAISDPTDLLAAMDKAVVGSGHVVSGAGASVPTSKQALADLVQSGEHKPRILRRKKKGVDNGHLAMADAGTLREPGHEHPLPVLGVAENGEAGKEQSHSGGEGTGTDDSHQPEHGAAGEHHPSLQRSVEHPGLTATAESLKETIAANDDIVQQLLPHDVAYETNAAAQVNRAAFVYPAPQDAHEMAAMATAEQTVTTNTADTTPAATGGKERIHLNVIPNDSHTEGSTPSIAASGLLDAAHPDSRLLDHSLHSRDHSSSHSHPVPGNSVNAQKEPGDDGTSKSMTPYTERQEYEIGRLVGGLPAMACNSCGMAETCPGFQEGAVCAYEPDFQGLTSRDLSNIIPRMELIADQQFSRAQMGVLYERRKAGGQIMPEVSRQLMVAMDAAKTVAQMKAPVQKGASTPVAVIQQNFGGGEKKPGLLSQLMAGIVGRMPQHSGIIENVPAHDPTVITVEGETKKEG